MATPRSIKLLKILKDGPKTGMRQSELLQRLCEAGRRVESANVMCLLDMRRKRRVGYKAPRKGEIHRGGMYIIRQAGVSYLARKLYAHPDWAEEIGEGEIETGLMRCEHPTIVLRAARDCAASLAAVGPNWIFNLAGQGPGVQHSQL